MSWLFISGGHSIESSASASVLPMSSQGRFPLGLTGLISWKSRDFQESTPAPQFKSISCLVLSFFMVQLSHPYMTTGKIIALTTWTFIGKVMSLFFNMLSRFVIAFLPRSKRLLISWLQSIHSDFGAQENKVYHCFHFSPHLFAMKWWDRMPWPLFFDCWVVRQLFHSPLPYIHMSNSTSLFLPCK